MQPQSTSHIYSLPQELLDSLILRTLVPEHSPIPRNSTPTPTSAQDDKQSQGIIDGISTHGADIGARGCSICLGVSFVDVGEQRSHFRSDWHRYNVKMRLGGGQAVSEEKFGQLVEALDDSLSGSASSSDDDDEESEEGRLNAVDALINKTKRLNASLNPTSDDDTSQKQLPRSPLAWFHSPQRQIQLGVYTAVFPSYLESDAYLEELQSMQTSGQGERTWAMFMVAGGHFAGAIIKVGKSDEEKAEDAEDTAAFASGKRKKLKKPKPENEILRHKTFHRYTTRRKQGGSQSLNDNAKGPAKSAGAQLRRYGEQALRDDIRNLLIDWADDIDACERIWIRASISNRRIFLDFEGPIVKGDIRLRTFPFPTRRPTQSELARCLLQLTRPKFSHLTEEELRQQDEAYLAAIKPKPAKPVPPATSQPARPTGPVKPKLTKEEEMLKDKWLRVYDMISRNRLEVLKSFWDREGETLGGINVLVPEYVQADASGSLKKAGTLLQAAAAAGSEEILVWLLDEKDADPTIPTPTTSRDENKDGIEHEKEEENDPENLPLKPGTKRVAYDLAKTKTVRDIFRRSAANQPNKWDWLGAARVPSGLSKEMEEDRDEKKKIRRKGLKEKVRERVREAAATKDVVEIAEPESTPVTPKPEQITGPRKLGGTAGTMDGVAGLTPEMRARVERERRARAAEARLKALR